MAIKNEYLAEILSGTFQDSDLNSSGILTISHNFGLAAPYVIIPCIFDNNNHPSLPANNKITGAANSCQFDLSAYLSTDTYTKLLLHGDASPFVDETGKTVTNNGATLDTDTKKFGAGSIRFDGTDDYLSLADSDDWNFGSGDFTIDFWVRFAATPTDVKVFTQVADTNNRMFFKMTSSLIYFYIISEGITVIDASAFPSFNNNQWYHIALVRSGSTGYIFVDGASQDITVSAGAWSNTFPNIAASFIIGSYAGTGDYLNGCLDEVRISKGIARWTANFTPPTSAYIYKFLSGTWGYILAG